MAIVVGLRCAGGIVVCANRQMSAPGASHSYERNVTIESSQSILFAYSGLSSLAREAYKTIRKNIGQEKVSSGLLYQAADKVLSDMRRQYVDLNLQLLIGRSAESEEPTLFNFDGKDLHVADEFNFLQVSDSCFLRFLAATMHSPQMSIEEITHLAVYLVRNAGRYLLARGGMSIDIAIMKSGDRSCRLLLEEDVQNLVRKVEGNEAKLIPLLARRVSS